jgi:hypothetical protein
LGWIISGPLQLNKENQNICLLSVNDVQDQLQKFWELEEVSQKPRFNKDQTFCIDHFEKTFSRETSGRLRVSLSLKENHNQLLDNFPNAEKRFLAIERKLQRDEKLKSAYTKFMREYESLNHMSKLNETEINTSNLKYYLPHHCVYKKDSDKIRVVFDASSKGQNGLSLNDVCYVGPTLQEDLFSIMLRFRKHNFVLKADVVKMYRQINIKHSERNLQRILWRENPNHKLNHYNLNTVTYGTAPAAFLAIRSLQQTAYDFQNEYPEACAIILSDFYVDDLCTGSDSIDKLIALKEQI